MNSVITPPQLAQRLGVSPDKILKWIARGELAALNVASDRKGRPRWVITPEALAAFERARSNCTRQPAAQRARRRPRQTRYIQYV